MGSASMAGPDRPEGESGAGGSGMGGWGRVAWAAVLVGLGLRVAEYANFRHAHMDETALLANLVEVPIFDFHHALKNDQLAPPGFLAVERMLVRLPIDVLASGRLFSLACGLASMFLIVPLARRYAARAVVPLAAWVLALSDHLIYYSADIKPYMCDLVATMVALLIADRPAGRGRLAALAGFGVIAPWFSFPVVFVLAGVGLHLIARRAIARDWRGVAGAVLACGAWLASFVGCFAVSQAIAGRGDFLRAWWDFAFLPIPPRSWVDVRLLAETLANVFINPGSLLTPFALPVTAYLSSGLAILGCVSLARRWAGGLFLLLAPVALALLGSALRQYPFHGRLILYLVPTYQLLFTEGIACIGKRLRGRVAIVVVAVFFVGMSWEVFWNFVISKDPRFFLFDTHADLKNDLLDYLEKQREGPPTTFGPR